MPRIGCRSAVAGTAPRRSPRTCSGRSVDPALDPHLVDRRRPAGEQADAVAGRGDLVEPFEQAGPGEVLEGALADLVGGLDVQGHPGHGAERAQPDDQAVEVRVAPCGRDHLARGGDQLQAGDGGGQVAVGVPGAVGGGGHRPRDRDVGQRGQVGQGQALGLEHLGQLPVAQAAGQGHRARGVVDDHVGRQPVQGEQLGRVGDVVERVPRAEHPQPAGPGDQLPHLVQGRRPVQGGGPVGVVPGPVPLAHAGTVTYAYAEQATSAPPGRGRARPVPAAGRGGQGLRDLPARPGGPGGQLELGRGADQGVHGRGDPRPALQPVLRAGRRGRRPPGRAAGPRRRRGPLPGPGLAGPQGRPPLLRPGDAHRPVRQRRRPHRLRQDHPGHDRRAGGRAGPPRPRVPAGRGPGGRPAGQLRVGAGQRPGHLEPGAVPDPGA